MRDTCYVCIKVSTVDGTPYDVIFVGTLNGWVIKVINAAALDEQVVSTVVEEIRVLDKDEPVRTLQVTPSPFTGKPAQLVVVGDSVVKALPLHRCSSPKLTSCT